MPVERFVDSYLRYPAGHDHRLVFLLKGFPRQLPSGLSSILDRVPHARMVCPDEGYDIGSYIHAAEKITEPVVVFLNSFTTIRADAWLSKLARAYSSPETGLVGTTGSWESMATTRFTVPTLPDASRVHRFLAQLRARLVGVALLMLFPSFPNPHIRSNGFMMARQDFLAIKPARIRFKLQAWMFESGRNSMTRRIMRRGLNVAVVGCDGAVYGIQDWPNSKTFWQDQQDNLLIHDNRTIAYAEASPPMRERLFRSAWGNRKVH